MDKNTEVLSFLPLGGEENVTRNMYLYQYKDQILIVDCGLGFPDETMLGVDLLLPDITYLLEELKAGRKKIVGMVLTHGHEDHIGGLPFILPQLPEFPIYASPLTAALSNEKMKEFRLNRTINTVKFTDPEIKLGNFVVSFVRVTHSVPDSANIIIKSPVGNFYHGSDYKFDLTPADGKRTEFEKIVNLGSQGQGVLSLMSDCLGATRRGNTPSEQTLTKNFTDAIRSATGKVFITTYSSNVSRMNQAIAAAESIGRKVCFVGRSMIKVKEIGQRLGYLQMKPGTEVAIEGVKSLKNNQVVLIVAGSQGQENSALTRIANGEHKFIRLDRDDVVVFSADIIPGNEINVNSLIDSITKRGGRVAQSEMTGMFHVSGHGSSNDHMLLIALTKPKFLTPISGTYRDMVAYREFSQAMGYKRNDIFLLENGQEVLFTPTSAKFGKKIGIKHVFVDEVSGGELENFVIRDRERLGKEGIAVVIAEVKTEDGQLSAPVEIVLRGSALTDANGFSKEVASEIEKELALKKEPVANWAHVRKVLAQTVGRHLFRKFRARPLILPVVIEV